MPLSCKNALIYFANLCTVACNAPYFLCMSLWITFEKHLQINNKQKMGFILCQTM